MVQYGYIKSWSNAVGLEKINFHGTIISVQPRIRLLRSFDERSHSYLGYAIKLKGYIDNNEREFSLVSVKLLM